MVENRAGGGNNIGTEAAARSPADGYTLFMANTVNAINTSLYQNLNYIFIADFVPVANVMGSPVIMQVHPSVKANAAADLIASPRPPRQAQHGLGRRRLDRPHGGRALPLIGGIKLVHVPYRGESPGLTDLIGGQAQVMVATAGSSLQYTKAG